MVRNQDSTNSTFDSHDKLRVFSLWAAAKARLRAVLVPTVPLAWLNACRYLSNSMVSSG